ncbi:MAG: hypothetical protein H6658_14295 [Ardenticatenaceae bacterium]|nr:hypothetical protein [Ardenticatenaceae bacterium]
MKRLFQWIFVLGLTAVPPIIALQTYSQSPHLPAEIVPVWQQFLPVIFLSAGVAVSAFCVLKVPAYLKWPQELKLIFLTILAFLTLIILWLAVLLAHYSLAGLVLETAVAPPYVLIPGGIATLLLILGTFYWADQLYLQNSSQG